MARQKYSELLRDPRWQRKRLEVMQAADFACQECRDTTTTLNVHHPKYVRGRKPWEYEVSELRCLCEHCHKAEHGLAEKKPPVERTFRLEGGPCDGGFVLSDAKLPIVWAYEKAGQVITALDFQRVVVSKQGGRLAASHFFARGHPYMYSTMYGPQAHAEFAHAWSAAPFPVLVGVYGLMPAGHWIDNQGPEARGLVLPFRDPDALLLHIDSFINLVGEDFDEAAYWAE